MKTLLSALAALWLLLPASLAAQNTPVVVELFTSQGCSSCPPADKLMHKLAKRADVIALALHVDYWDYIGWKDQYARPENTRRQHRYAHRGGRDVVYTPQMIINGQDDVVGARAMELSELIMHHAMSPRTVTLTATRSGNAVRIEAEASTRPGAKLVVQLVRYTPSRRAKITRGENAGHTLTYANVVEAWTVLGEWDASAPLSVEADLQGDLPGVVLIQEKGTGPILAAARIN